MRQRSGAGMRLALVGLGVLALLAIVALASRGGLGGGAGGGGPAPSTSLVDYAFSIFLVAYVLTIPFLVYAVWLQRQEKARRGSGKSHWLTNLVVFLLFLLIAFGIAGLRRSRELQPHPHAPPPPAAAQQPTTTSGRPAHAAEPSFAWPVAAAAAALVLAGAAAWYLAGRRRRAARPPLPVAEELALALDDALDDVRAETDPRRAVIEAYARMEAILGAHGLPRHPAEAPFEYLARALGELHGSADSLARLTDLYERARFSLHEIGPELRDEAIEALTAVRDELRGAVAAAAGGSDPAANAGARR